MKRVWAGVAKEIIYSVGGQNRSHLSWAHAMMGHSNCQLTLIYEMNNLLNGVERNNLINI